MDGGVHQQGGRVGTGRYHAANVWEFLVLRVGWSSEMDGIWEEAHGLERLGYLTRWLGRPSTTAELSDRRHIVFCLFPFILF